MLGLRYWDEAMRKAFVNACQWMHMLLLTQSMQSKLKDVTKVSA